MKAIGQWNAAWDPFLALDPAWTDAFMATGAGIYGSVVLSPKEIELLSIAFDASFTHMYAPGTRRHIRNALKAGGVDRATPTNRGNPPHGPQEIRNNPTPPRANGAKTALACNTARTRLSPQRQQSMPSMRNAG
jgi:hypothetical protein